MDNSFVPQNVPGCTLVSVKPGEEEKKAIKKKYFTAGLIILADLFVFQFASRAVLTLIGLFSGRSVAEASNAGVEIIKSNEIIYVLFSSGFPIIAEIITIILAVRFMGLDLKKHFTLKGFNTKDIAGGFAAAMFCQTVAAFILVIIMMLFFKAENIQDVSVSMNKSLAANVIMYFYVCILGPVLEEIVFRGIVLESMREYNERFAIVFSALIFGLMHGNFPQAINAAAVGLVLGALYVRSDSLFPSSVIHILMNSIMSLLQVMMYGNPDIAKDILNGNMDGLGGITAVGLAISGMIRVVSLPAGIAVLVVTGLKGFGLQKATPAGKSRSYPLVLTSPVWIVVVLLYFAICLYNSGLF